MRVKDKMHARAAHAVRALKMPHPAMRDVSTSAELTVFIVYYQLVKSREGGWGGRRHYCGEPTGRLFDGFTTNQLRAPS